MEDIIKNNLIEYIIGDKEIEKEDFSIFSQLGVDRIIHEEFRRIYPEAFIGKRLETLKQKNINYNIFKNMKDIICLFNEYNIDYSILKGIPLAKQVYKSPEVRRTSDIDILVNKKDLIKIIRILSEIGYVDINNEIVKIEEVERFLSSCFAGVHFAPLFKNGIAIEIHVNLINKESFGFELEENEIKSILNSYLEVTVDDFNVRILNNEDNILFLSLHFLKHLFEPLLSSFIYGNATIGANLNLLYDIALFFCKYKDEINKEILICKIRKWKINNEINKVINIIYDIFKIKILDMEYVVPDRKNLISLISQNETKIDFKKLILGFYKYNELEKMVTTINIDKNTMYSNFKLSNERLKMLIINEKNNVINKEGKDNEILIMKSDWNKKYLNFYIKVKKSNPVWNQKNENKSQDTIRLCIENLHKSSKDSWVKSLLIEPKLVGNEVRLTLVEDIQTNQGITSWNTEWLESEYDYSIKLYEDYYKIDISLSWDKLGIKPEVGLEVYFDVVLYDFKNDIEKKKLILKQVLPWSNLQVAWYDITCYGKLIIV